MGLYLEFDNIVRKLTAERIRFGGGRRSGGGGVADLVRMKQQRGSKQDEADIENLKGSRAQTAKKKNPR